MGIHLYLCETGGLMTVGTDKTAPRWVTCPLCTKSLECSACPGAQLQGDAPPFAVAASVPYRCAAGHERMILLPAGARPPESTHCPDCDGMALPVAGSAFDQASAG